MVRRRFVGRSTIGIWLILGVGLVNTWVIGVLSLVTLKSHTRELLRERTRSANQISETIKRSIHYDMLENRRESLHRQIQSLGNLHEEGIRKLRLFNKEGQISFSSLHQEIGTTLDTRAEACYGCHAEGKPLEKLAMEERARTFVAEDGARVLGIINPIPNEPACTNAECHAHDPGQSVLGVLDVDVSLTAVDEAIARSQRLFGASAVLATVLSSLMVWWLHRKLVLRPVGDLVAGTQRVAAGDFLTPIPASSRHELGELARAFNEMTRRIAETQQQLTRVEKLASVGRLAAGVAHEINNPLTGVLSYASLLRRRLESDAEAVEDLEVIIRETKRCRTIIRDLLDFARPSPPVKTEMDLNEVVHRALAVARNPLELNQANVSLELSPSLPTANADPNQIQQVLVNLLLNAADALGERGGEVRVRTALGENDSLEVWIEDDGCGIAREDFPRLFEPFFSTKGPKGTGLGLAVSWGIVRSHGGSLEAKSEPGEGARFIVHLPKAQSSQASHLSEFAKE